MSDFREGPGWWMASDGKFYPPELHPNYQPPPPPTGADSAARVPPGGTGWSEAPEMPLHLWVLDPRALRRNRWTCAIRLIMVIPQAIVLIFVNLAALFAMVAGWFAALFLGRLPEGLRDYLGGALRWNTRVQGYLFLLTDIYPPYRLGEEYEYPVRLAIPPPLRLNRAAVLFRFFLAIPAWIVANVVNSGLLIVSIGSWFMILVTGRLPVPLYEATRAVLRYQARVFGYFSMQTPEYPWGVLGDGSPTAETLDPYEFWSIRLSTGGRAAMIVVIVVGLLSEVNQNRGRF